jgi:2,3-diketo-5-methylthio-1-phosphopentane phosphatase
MRKIAVLCDFDGTVAQDDVGNLLFRTFAAHGDAAEVVSRWERGEISSRECLEKEASLASCCADELRKFVHARTIDPYFKDFHDFARQRGIEVVVLSDGLDFYIEQILIRNGLGQIEFFANQLRLEGQKMRVNSRGTTCSNAPIAVAARPTTCCATAKRATSSSMWGTGCPTAAHARARTSCLPRVIFSSTAGSRTSRTWSSRISAMSSAKY